MLTALGSYYLILAGNNLALVRIELKKQDADLPVISALTGSITGRPLNVTVKEQFKY